MSIQSQGGQASYSIHIAQRYRIDRQPCSSERDYIVREHFGINTNRAELTAGCLSVNTQWSEQPAHVGN
jgi:hypothetical protein